MAIRRSKAEFLSLVDELFEAGLKSTTLLSEALGVSDEACRQALIVLCKHRPRRSLQDLLCGLPSALRHRVERFARLPGMLEVPTESAADD